MIDTNREFWISIVTSFSFTVKYIIHILNHEWNIYFNFKYFYTKLECYKYCMWLIPIVSHRLSIIVFVLSLNLHSNLKERRTDTVVISAWQERRVKLDIWRKLQLIHFLLLIARA